MATTKPFKVYHLELYTEQGGLLSRAAFGIAKMPRNKRHCLFLIEDDKCEAVAFFKTEEHAKFFRRAFNLWSGKHSKVGRVRGD